MAVVVAVVMLAPLTGVAQQASISATAGNATAGSALPHLVSYSGVLKDSTGKTLNSLTGITFLIYKDQQGGAPLWLETQSVTPDRLGHYSVQLGAANANGLPASVFQNGEARWLGVQIAGEAEQARVLLAAVPYAMKAADAETIGGLPPSAFMLAAPVSSDGTSANGTDTSLSAASSGAPPVTSNVTTTGGTINTIPLFTTTKNIQNSAIAQTGTGATAKIGIGTTTPATALDVKGAATVRGALSLPATGAATTAGGKNSQAEDFVASSFSSSTSTAVNQTFQWQAEPLNNNTTTPSGTLNLLYGLGAIAPSETGLKLSNKGVFTFAAGQTFPGTGPGTVKSVGLTAPASDFTVSGSPVTGTGTLNFAWTVAPTSADTANAVVKRDGSGNFSAGTVTANNLNATNATISNFLSMPTAVSQAISATASSGGATTILGRASATSGAGWGVEGETDSSSSDAYGVIGFAGSSSGNPKAVYGQASSISGIGVFGQNGSESFTGSAALTAGFSSGAWGDGGTGGTIGVLGTADTAIAGFFASNTGGYTMWVQNLTPSTSWISGYGPNVGMLSAYCYVDGSGNLNCTGAKNAVVPVDGGKRTVAMSAIEAPQNWFEDFGEAQLVNGVAVVTLDPDFIQTVNTNTNYKVFPVANGDCKGLYVTNKTANSFEVHELGGGTSNISFDYRITVLRKKYESVRFADHTHDMDAMKLMQEKAKVGAGKPQSHEPGKKLGLVPAKTAQLAVPGLQSGR